MKHRGNNWYNKRKEKINNIIEEEFQFIESNFSEKRRTLIELDYKNLSIEDYIKNEEVLVTLTHKGYLKRLNNFSLRYRS